MLHPKSAFIACLCLLPACCALFSAPACASGLTFRNGEIVGPGGTVSLNASGTVAIATTGGDSFSLTVTSVVKGGKPYWSANDLSDKKLVVDAAHQQTTFSATITDPALPAPIPVTYSIALTPAGKARVTLQYGGTQPITNFLSIGAIFFYSQREPLIGSQVSVNDASFPIANTPRTNNWKLLSGDNENVREAAFFSDDPYKVVTAHVVTASSETVSDENLTGWQSVGLRIYPLNNQSVIDVDLPTKVKPLSTETYGGSDYYAAEHIHLPQYNLSRNLVQNPSFEEGLQYWNFGVWGKVVTNRIPDYYMLDSSQTHSGHKSLKLLGEVGVHPAPVASLAIPVNIGKPYTLSFYAKGDRANLNLGSDVWPAGSSNTGPIFFSSNLTQSWQRYSYTFNAPGPDVNVGFGNSLPQTDCAIYVDDVQLEAGATMTDFTRKPLEMALATDHRDNLFAPGVPVHGRWQLSGVPGSSGKIAVTLRNVLGVSLQQHTAAFKLGPTGTASVPEPWLEHTERGMYILEATAATADGFHVREYGRLTIAPPADPTAKHHALFAMGGTPADSGSWDRLTGQLQYFGIGSAVNFDPPQHGHLAVLAAHHITDVTAIFNGDDQFSLGSTTIKLKSGWTGPDSDLPILEEAAYEKAKAYPEIDYWKLLNEPQGDLKINPVTMKRLVVALTAVRNGILRAHPGAHILSMDPSDMSPEGGIAMIDNFLSQGGGAICDIEAIHPYRSRPEDPDLDADLATYLSMLSRHGYHGEVWFTEGGGWLGVHNPALGTDVHNALSNEFLPNAAWWGIGNLSYDAGDGERYAAAYSQRSWLVGLKYGDRVRQFVEWYFQTGVVDYDGTPQLRSIALNNLTTLLGSADYVKDIPLSADVRCYLFQDPQHRPIAVVWSHDLQHETQTLPPSVLHLGTLASSLQMFNMDGSRATVDKTGALAVLPFPIFLRGAAGSAAKLAATLGNGFVAADVGSVIGYAQVTDGGHVGIELRSTLAKTVRGTLSFAQNSSPGMTVPVALATGKTVETLSAFPTEAGGVSTEDGDIKLKVSGSAKSLTFPVHVASLLCPQVSGPLPMDGNLASWKSAGANVFPIPQHMMSYKPFPANPKYPNDIPWGGPADLSGTFAVAYAPGTLYLAFDVTDDVLSPAPTPDVAWQGDSIQLYFDPWRLGHTLSKTGGHYEDEQELDIWPNAGSVTLYRAIKPYDQVAFTKLGIVADAKSSFTARPGGYVVQLAIPQTELAPMYLKPGGVFNFAFLVNDSDGDFRKRALTLTPDGTEPFQHQDLWPSVVLGASHQ